MSATPLQAADPCLFGGNIGLARVDITPPVGIYARNWGAAKHDVATSIHRPLSITAVTLRTGDEQPLVLIDADLGFWTSLDRFHTLRAEVLKAFHLPSERLIFAITHSHATPHLCTATEDMAGGDLLETWLQSLTPATINVINQALENEQPSTLDWNRGVCRLASTRDLADPLSNGSRRVCGYDPSVPADDTLLLGRICDASGKIRATLVNYACHPTTLAFDNTAISPDYIGAMRETIEKATDGAPALFLLGACGELSPKHQYVGDTSIADRHGRQLGYAALATLEDMEPAGTRLAFDRIVESGAPLAVWRPQPIEASTTLQAVESAVPLTLKPDLPSAEELDRQFHACEDRALKERLRRKRNMRLILGERPEFPLPMWAWRIGNAIVFGSMGEAYSVTQTTLRERFPDHQVIVLNLINGTIGYLTPAHKYDENLYQVWQSPFERGCLEQYIEAATQLIASLIDEPAAS